MPDFYSFETAAEILRKYRTFAIVGCSPDPTRPSFGVAMTLLRLGYDAIPVNPQALNCFGKECYPDLASVPTDIDIEVVDLFRRSEFVAPHVDEAIERGAKAIWMQLGVIDEVAAQKASDAGLLVVMDRCPARDLPRLGA